MVLVVDVGSNRVGNSQEVRHVLVVGDVSVEVVLEMLEHVHVLLNELVSSNSWEGEGLVIEFPSVNVHLSGKTLLLKSFLDVQSVSPVSSIEVSGEHVDLVVEFSLSFIKVDAWY